MRLNEVVANFGDHPKLIASIYRMCSRFDIDADVRITFCDRVFAATTAINVPGKRIILVSQKLIEMCTEKELDGVLAHEYVHIKRNHGIWGYVTDRLFAGIVIVAFTLLYIKIPQLSKEELAVFSTFDRCLLMLVMCTVCVGSFSLRRLTSQEIEAETIALSAHYINDTQPIVSFFEKGWALCPEYWRKSKLRMMTSMFFRHPKYEEIITSLRRLNETSKIYGWTWRRPVILGVFAFELLMLWNFPPL